MGDLWCVGTLGTIAAAGSDIDDLGAMEEAVYDGMGDGGIS